MFCGFLFTLSADKRNTTSAPPAVDSGGGAGLTRWAESIPERLPAGAIIAEMDVDPAQL